MALGVVFVVGFTFFIINVFIHFLNGLLPEERLQKYVNEQCVAGNQIAIKIRREKSLLYVRHEELLIRSAIEGNEFAIKALKLNEDKKHEF